MCLVDATKINEAPENCTENFIPPVNAYSRSISHKKSPCKNLCTSFPHPPQ